MRDRWCAEPPPPLLLEGIAQFNRAEFFEQHETLEALWRAKGRAEARRPCSTVGLWEYGGLSYEELGRVLGAKAGTIMSRLNRARAAVASFVKEAEHEQDDRTL